VAGRSVRWLTTFPTASGLVCGAPRIIIGLGKRIIFQKVRKLAKNLKKGENPVECQ